MSNPIDPAAITTSSRAGLRRGALQYSASVAFPAGVSECVAAIDRMTRLVAARNTPVLITGPQGNGKAVLASVIHRLSPRGSGPFIAINCADKPKPLLEADLFGSAGGASDAAAPQRLGGIHSAHGGTLFLNEVGELPLELQSRLLRFLDQGEVQPLGSRDVFRVDVRVIAASSCALAELARQSPLRQELFYRLAVFPIELPPLSQEDAASLPHPLLPNFASSSNDAPTSRQQCFVKEEA